MCATVRDVASKDGVVYAEQTLEVHQAYIAARDAGERADDARRKSSVHREARSLLLEDISQREAQVTRELWAANPDMPVTRMEKQLKVALIEDTNLIDYRNQLRTLEINLDEFEVQAKKADTDVRILAARMVELGGYLQYLAALKMASTSSSTTKPENQS